MPLCLVRYRAHIRPRDAASTTLRPVDLVVSEEWEADARGAPQRCIRRLSLLQAIADDGSDFRDRLSGQASPWRIYGAKMIGPVCWLEPHSRGTRPQAWAEPLTELYPEHHPA